jgi:hypothetical protein
MSFNSINIVSYKTVCILSFLASASLGIKIVCDQLLVKGLFSLFSAAIFALLFFQKPSLRTWLQVIAVIVINASIIGELAKI